MPPGQTGAGRSRAGLAATAGWLLAVPGWERALLITAAAATYGARAALLVLIWAGAVGLAWVILTAPRRAGRRPDISACRDDGPIARFAGSVVRGQLAPLPPAVAGLFATVLLAVLGLHGLAGPVLLTPVAAMLLAAPGSAHPHDGPADWLAPAVVQAGEYVYLAALGFAKGVPGPVTCALIALVALRQLDAAQAAGRAGPRRYSGIGWEGRMLAAGPARCSGWPPSVTWRWRRTSAGSCAAPGCPGGRRPSRRARPPRPARQLSRPSVAPEGCPGRAARMPPVEGVAMLQLRQAPLRRCGREAAGWRSPVTIPRRWLAALFGCCALFAGGMALFSSNGLHRLWGVYAAGGYLLAAVLVLAWRSPRSADLALLAALGGALLAPLGVLAAGARWQPEVWVIARAARLLVQHGSPYESQAVLAVTHDPNSYNPYLPVMAVFGLPRALFGQGLVTDPRIWFGLGFFAACSPRHWPRRGAVTCCAGPCWSPPAR